MKTFKNKYFEFTPEWSGFNLKYHIAGYFDARPMLQLYLIWGKLFIYLPWKHYVLIECKLTEKEKRKQKLRILKDKNAKIEKKYEKVYYDDCDPPCYGIYFYARQFCINFGKKTKLYDLPWMLNWIRTSVLRKDDQWEHSLQKKEKDFWDQQKWKDVFYNETHPYSYTTKSGEEQNCLATINVYEREWRWKWFKWLKWTALVIKTIEIKFDSDIGERKGTWKGGCVECSYEMLQNETPYECLKRMERERIF